MVLVRSNTKCVVILKNFITQILVLFVVFLNSCGYSKYQEILKAIDSKNIDRDFQVKLVSVSGVEQQDYGNISDPIMQFTNLDKASGVIIYNDDQCENEVARSLVQNDTASAQVQLFEEKNYQFYYRIVHNASIGDCSDEYITYTLDKTSPGLPIVTLKQGQSSPSSSTNIYVHFADLEEGSRLKIFSDSSCETEVINNLITINDEEVDIDFTLSQDGTYKYYAYAIDNAGNKSICSTTFAEYVLSRPLAPTSIIMKNPIVSTSNDTTPEFRISGGVAAGDVVTLYKDDECSDVIGSATSNSTFVDIVLAQPLLAGIYHFFAKKINSIGMTSSCSNILLTYTLDLSAPLAPSGISLITPLSNISNNRSPMLGISGIIAGDTIKIFSDNSCTAEVFSVVANAGAIAVTLANLNEGIYTFHASSTDASGNESTCSLVSQEYIVDLTPPGTPTGLTLAAGAITPSMDTTPTIDINGTQTGSTVGIYSDATCSTLVKSTTTNNIKTSVTLDPLDDGSYNFYSKTYDEAGNSSGCTAALTYIVDTVAPGAPNTIVLLDPLSSPSNDETPSFRIGGVSSGDTVSIFIDNSCSSPLGSAIANGNSVDITSSSLANGIYNFYASSADSAGNNSSCSLASVVYTMNDGQPPPVPTELILVTPNSSPGNIANPTVRVSGVRAGVVVKVFKENNCTNVVGSGNATGASVDIQLNSLGVDASYSLYARTRDAFNTDSNCSVANLVYVLDRTAPSTPTGLTLVSPVSSPSQDRTPELQITGVISGDIVKLFSDANCTTLVGEGTSTGNTINVASEELIDGDYNFHAKSYDLAGNASTCSVAGKSYTVDNIADNPPNLITLFEPAISPSDDKTPTVTVHGVVNGSTVKVFSDSSCTSEVGTAASNDISCEITVSQLNDDTRYYFYAKSIDQAGNATSCSTAKLAYSVVPTPPNSIIIQDPSVNLSNDNTPEVLVGGVSAGQIVKLFRDNACNNLVSSKVAAGTSVVFNDITLNTSATHTFYATRVGVNGSSNCSTAFDSYQLDITPPALASSLVLKEPAASPDVSMMPVITVNGAEASSIVRLYRNSSCTIFVGESATGANDYTDVTVKGLTAGTYNFYAKIVDQAGNVSGCSTASVSYTSLGPSCPTGFIRVPANSALGTVYDFCVAKYEMKDLANPKVGVEHGAISDATSTVFTQVTQAQAIDLCEGMPYDGVERNDSYYLITNSEWMTIARNIEGVAANFSAGKLNQGHHQGEPASILTASNDDNLSCTGVTPSGAVIDSSACSSTVWHKNRRTHKLTTGEWIWDFSGNASEWIEMSLTNDRPGGTAAWVDISTLTATATMPATAFKPTNAAYTHDSNGIGKFYAGTNGATTYVYRGGTMNNDLPAGIYNFFGAAAADTTTDTAGNQTIGFRCVYRLKPNPIGTLSIVNGNGTATPTIRVTNAVEGTEVYLYSDNQCTNFVGSTLVNADGAVEIQSSALANGPYEFHAKVVDIHGSTNDCSTSGVSYSLNAPAAPTNVILISPADASANDSVVKVLVEGVQSGDTVQLYSNGSCSNLVDSKVATNTSTSFDLYVENYGTYSFYAKRTSSGVTSPCSSSYASYNAVPLDECPENYLLVNKNEAVGQYSSFCVSKYEMKQDGNGNAISDYEGLPWTDVSQTNAINECKYIGINYRLISNFEWMAIARDIESVEYNFSAGNINRGHSDSEPNAPLRASVSDDDGCYENSNSCSSTVWNSERRILKMSSGVYIWDFAGNVWEWLDWTVSNLKAIDGVHLNSEWMELNSIAETASMEEESYRPINAILAANNGIGAYYPGNEGVNGVATRGGSWKSGVHSGIYSLMLDMTANSFNDETGFRCVYRPENRSATAFKIITTGTPRRNVAFTVSIEAVDNFGNIDRNFQGDVSLETDSATITGEGIVSITNGEGSLVLTNSVTESVTLSLSDSQGTGIDVSCSKVITFSN